MHIFFDEIELISNEIIRSLYETKITKSRYSTIKANKQGWTKNLIIMNPKI